MIAPISLLTYIHMYKALLRDLMSATTIIATTTNQSQYLTLFYITPDLLQTGLRNTFMLFINCRDKLVAYTFKKGVLSPVVSEATETTGVSRPTEHNRSLNRSNQNFTRVKS